MSAAPPPGPIEPTRTLQVPRPDATLYAEWFAPAGTPKGLVVVSHGYAEHCGRYREVANALVRAGTAVLTYDVRGHGHSDGPRGHVDRFATYLDDLDAVVAWGRGECAKVGLTEPRLILLGHSHGSLITLRNLTDTSRATNAVAAAVASPFLGLRMKVNPVKKVASKVVARVYPTLARDDHRFDELVRLTAVVRSLNRGNGIVGLRAHTEYSGVVPELRALPSLVAVHAVVPTAEARNDGAAGSFRDRLLHVPERRLGQRVAAVE